MQIFLLILKSLPDLLFIIRRHMERADREAIRREGQDFLTAVATGNEQTVSELLAERVRKLKDG